MNKKNNYKNRKRRGTPDPRTKKDLDREKSERPQNDPAWYSKYPQLVADTSNLFFSNPLGARVPKLAFDSGTTTVDPNLVSVPGIMALNAIAVPGFSRDVTSPVNAVARGIYSYIRHANSGSKNYEAPDLMMYLLAMDTCYSFWAECVRAYGVARMYNVRNRYLSKEYLEVLGFNGNDIISNLAQFRAMINTFAVKLGSFAVPASMDFFRRHTDMYTKVFLDEPSPKAQAYLFRLAYYYKFYNDATDGGKLLYTAKPSATMTMAQVASVMGEVLDPIMGDEDMNVMSGDILKAYGDGGIFKVPMISEEYVTPFIFDETILSQIENSYAVTGLDSTSMGVTQNPATGAIIFSPMISNKSNRFYMPSKLLNIHHDNPSAMDVMEGTRLMYSLEYDTDLQQLYVTNFGTELILGYVIYGFDNMGILTPSVSMPFTAVQDTGEFQAAQPMLTTLSNLGTFNFHPRMTVWMNGSGSAKKMVIDSFLLDNYTTIDDSVLANISNTAMLSLFDVGHIALQQ